MLLKNITVLVLFSFFLTFYGCVNPRQMLTPVENQPNIGLKYIEGNRVAISTLSNSTFAVLNIERFQKDLTIEIVCSNNSETDIDVKPSNINVLGYNLDNINMSFKPMSTKEVMKKIKLKQDIENIVYQFDESMKNTQAGEATTTTDSKTTGTVKTTVTGNFSTNSNYYNTGYNTTGQFDANANSNLSSTTTSTSKTVDYGEKRKAEKALQQEMEFRNNVQAQLRNNVKSGLLKANTLTSGQSVAGRLIVKITNIEYIEKFIVVAQIGQDKHMINFITLTE